jgi:hypothetical protein
MEKHVDAQVSAANGASRPGPSRSAAGLLLGWYTTAQGRRHVRAVPTDDGLCVIDEAEDGALLVEPRLEEMAEARALAADYLALASERGKPQSRHPCPAIDSAAERGEE